MTTELYEDENIKLFSYWNGKRKVYQVVTHKAVLEVVNKTDSFDELMEGLEQ